MRRTVLLAGVGTDITVHPVDGGECRGVGITSSAKTCRDQPASSNVQGCSRNNLSSIGEEGLPRRYLGLPR